MRYIDTKVYRCELCGEIIKYEVTEFLDMYFCDDDCLDKYVEEEKIKIDISRF